MTDKTKEDIKNHYKGWTISKGDYIRDGDSYGKKRILKRIQIIKRIAVIVGISAGLIFLLFIFDIISGL